MGAATPVGFNLGETIRDESQRLQAAEGATVAEDAQSYLELVARQNGAGEDISNERVTEADARRAIAAVFRAARKKGHAFISKADVEHFVLFFCDRKTHLWWC